MKVRHNPIIESVPGHPDDALFTFIWEAAPGQVAVNTLFNGWFPLHAQRGFDYVHASRGQQRLVHELHAAAHGAVSIRAGRAEGLARFAGSRHLPHEWTTRSTEDLHDPLNPDLVDWNDSIVSHAQGPAAKTSVYLKKRSGVPAGVVENLEVDSKVLGNKRTVRVYLPPGIFRAVVVAGRTMGCCSRMTAISTPRGADADDSGQHDRGEGDSRPVMRGVHGVAGSGRGVSA